MKTLSRAATRPGVAGEPLPVVWPVLGRAGITPRRGQVTMIAAPPGGGKSAFTLAYLVKALVGSLYISADTDAWTTVVRALAMLTGRTQRDLELELLDPELRGYFDHYLATLDNIKFVFETDPTYMDIYEEVLAYYEAMGEYPEVIVVDNLMNIVGEQEDEWAGMRETSKFLKRLGRETGAAVIVLHHVGESSSLNPLFPAPRHAIQGKVSQLPEMILTVAYNPESGHLAIAGVKMRQGKPDPSGRTYVNLIFDAASMTFIDRTQFAERESA